MAEPDPPVVVLGAGYAGLTVAREVARRGHGELPIVLVDRHPVHVLRTELYELGKLAAQDGSRDWTVPLARVFRRPDVTLREAAAESIDLDARRVHLSDGELSFGMLAVCLGSVAAFYRVPGAEEHTEQVYRLTRARRLAGRLRQLAAASSGLPGERRSRVVVVGGGSTGTEVAAEIASTDWSQVVGQPCRPFDVVLLTGGLPFLAGLDPGLVRHATELLRRAGVSVVHGVNVSRVEPGRVHLEDGSLLACDVAVWCAGLEAPQLVADLPTAHGKAGRVAVEPTLELPERPGVVAVGDVAEIRDPTTGILVPATAQAALAEARVAAANLVARRQGTPLVPFRYRERGVFLAVGRGRGAGSVRHLTVWGSPAALVKRLVERAYSEGVSHGDPGRLL